MGEQPLISIIIPIYNVEKYLVECLESVVNQTYKCLEIICVNDGSTDKSADILKKYAANDKRICIINQENSGVAKARNNALSKATGKYVIFWDSDDYFDLNAIELLLERIESAEADVCICDVQRFDHETGGKIPANYIPRPLPKDDVFSWKTWTDVIFLNSAVSCNKLIRRTLLIENDIKYPEIHIYEDFEFMTLLMRLAEKIVMVNKKLIYYRRNREGSLTYDPGKEMDTLILTHNHAYDILESRGLFNNQRLLNCFVHKTAIDYRYFCLTFNNITHFRNFFKRLSELDTVLNKYDSSEGSIPGIEFFDVESAEEFLVGEYIRFFELYEKHRQNNIERNAEIKLLKELRKIDQKTQKELTQKLEGARAEIQSLTRIIQTLKEDVVAQKKELVKIQRRYNKIINSISYKVARIITWIPRKLKRWVREKRKLI